MEIALILRYDRVDKQGCVPIHLRICWQGNKVRFSVGEKIYPVDWDEETSRVKTNRKAKSAKLINYKLDVYTNHFEEYFDQNKQNRVAITPAMVRSEIKNIRIEKFGFQPVPEPVSPEPPSPTEFVRQYIAERKADRSESWIQSMKVVIDHLVAFRPGVAWVDLKLSTLNLFKVYLVDELELSDATLQTYIGLLCGMLKYAGRWGILVPPDYDWLETRKPGDTLQAELSYDEIKLLQNAFLVKSSINHPSLLLKLPDALEQTRWYFLVACCTGLRYSDWWQLVNPKITWINEVPCLEVYQQKTRRRVPIPLDDDIYHLIRNSINQSPPLKKEQFNSLLKEIGQQAQLNRIVNVGTYYNGKLLAEQLPLHQTMSSHMARRTFATLMTQGGLSTRILQEIMGHASITSTQKYAKVSNIAIVRQAIEAMRKVEINSR